MSFSAALKARQQKKSFVQTDAKASGSDPKPPTGGPGSVALPEVPITSSLTPDKDGILSDTGVLDAPVATPPHQQKPEAQGDVWTHPSGAYDTLPKFVEIRASQEAGRGIYVKVDAQTLAAGSRILSVQPHARTLSTANLSSYCSTCQRSGDISGELLKRCTKCRVVHYCSLKCQTHDWSIHKSECTALQSWMGSSDSNAESTDQTTKIPGEAVRALARLLWGMEKTGLDSQWSQEVKLMQSHRRRSPTSSDTSVAVIAQSLARYMSNSGQPTPGILSKWGLLSAAELLEFLSQFVVNSFTLTTPSLTPIGVAISPLAALLNHSCAPNAVVVFPRTSALRDPLSNPLEVIAIRDIKRGEEVLTSYVDLSLPYRHRFKELKERYSFECGCKLCLVHGDLTAPDPRQCIRCSVSGCGGVLPLLDPDSATEAILRCIECGSVFTGDIEEIHDVVRLGEEALTKATALEIAEPVQALRLTTNMTPLLESRLPITSHPLLALLRLHQTLLISELSASIAQRVSQLQPTQDEHSKGYRTPQAEVDKVCASAMQALSGIIGVFPDGHPVRAIALAELGKLLCVDVEPEGTIEGGPQSPATGTASPPVASPKRMAFASGAARLQQAREFLLMSRVELKKGFGGDGGEVGREVEDRIRNLEKEWVVWRRVVSQGGLKV